MSSFHSTTVVFSVWFFNHSDHHSYCRYCHIVKNKCWLCLISEYAKHFFFVLLEKLCVQQKPSSDAYLEPCQQWSSFLSKYATAFTSIIPFWQVHEFTPDHDTVFFFSNQTSLQNLVFLENCYKKGDMSYDFTFG